MRGEPLKNAHLLREMAIAEEKEWIQNVDPSVREEDAKVEAETQYRLIELFKDIAEEFHSKGLYEKGTAVRRLFSLPSP